MSHSYAGVPLRNRPMVYTSLALAEQCAASCIKAAWIVLGNVGEYVVVCPADYSRLTRAGFLPA